MKTGHNEHELELTSLGSLILNRSSRVEFHSLIRLSTSVRSFGNPFMVMSYLEIEHQSNRRKKGTSSLGLPPHPHPHIYPHAHKHTQTIIIKTKKRSLSFSFCALQNCNKHVQWKVQLTSNSSCHVPFLSLSLARLLSRSIYRRQNERTNEKTMTHSMNKSMDADCERIRREHQRSLDVSSAGRFKFYAWERLQ